MLSIGDVQLPQRQKKREPVLHQVLYGTHLDPLEISNGPSDKILSYFGLRQMPEHCLDKPAKTDMQV